MQKTSDSDCSSAHCNFGSYRQQPVSADYCSVDAARYFIYIASRRKSGCSQVGSQYLICMLRGNTHKEIISSRELHAKRKPQQGDNLFT